MDNKSIILILDFLKTSKLYYVYDFSIVMVVDGIYKNTWSILDETG